MFKVRACLPILAALGLAMLAGVANAACCNVPTTHQVRVPGVVVGRPTVSQGCASNCAPAPSCQEGCGQKPRSNEASFSVTATASANSEAVSSAFARSSAFGLGGAVNGSSGFGGSGSSFYVDYNSGYIPNLSVEEGAAAVSAAYQATRTVVKVMAIQVVCVDDKAIPHPASQVTPDREVAETYEGELYRCLAGTRMQYTVAEYLGKVSFDQGQTTTCEKNHALYHPAGGKIECRPQKPGRDCNERSLLRRYGAGIKIVKMMWTETYTAYRTEMQQVQASAMGMAIDGGVGGIAH